MRKVLLPIVVLFFAYGCKPKPEIHPQQPPVKPLASGWTEATSKDGAVSIGVAPGWRNGFDRVSMDFGNLGLEGSGQANPALQEMAQRIDAAGEEKEKERMNQLFEKGILFHVINGGRPVFDETRTRYIVQRYESGGNWDFDAAADKERGQYAFKPQRQEVTLPIGKALKLSASEELRNGSTLHRISYLAIDGKKLYVLRFLTQENKEVIHSIADSVAETWRIRASK